MLISKEMGLRRYYDLPMAIPTIAPPRMPLCRLNVCADTDGARSSRDMTSAEMFIMSGGSCRRGQEEEMGRSAAV